MSDAGTIAQNFLNAYNNKLDAVAPKAVVSQILLMGGLSLVTVLVFNLLRPKNRIIYEPKSKYYDGENKRPPKIAPGFFSWVRPLITTKEADLLPIIGLDAVVFLRFLRLLRWVFTLIALITCTVLIPINYVWANQSNRNSLSQLTVSSVTGNILYVHVGITYLITFIILAFIYVHWRAMVSLRRTFFRSPEYTSSFYARTLLLTSISPSYQSDPGIRQLYTSIQVPYPTTAVHIGRQVGKLPELIEYHNDTVRELEQVLVSYLKGGKVGKRRPTIRIGGVLGMGGQKVDAIDYYTEKVKRLDTQVEEWRNSIDLKKPESYGFASLSSVPYAHTVAQLLRSKHPKGSTITLAPNPKDIIWANLSMPSGKRYRLRITGFFLLVLVCFFNTLPLAAISALSNLAALTQFVPFLNDWSNQSNFTFSIVSGVLPPSVSGLFGYFLPLIMRKLSKYSGDITRSRLDRAVIARYYAFLVISQFLIFSLVGVIFQVVSSTLIPNIGVLSAAEIFQNIENSLPSQVQQTYVSQSNYWLTWYPLRGFLVFFDLAQLVNLVYISVRTHLFGRTPRAIRDWTRPPSFDYAIYLSNLLFMATVGLLYAPLAPLVALMAAVVFWFSSVIYKYQLMFVFTTKVESGGRLWNLVINRLLTGTIFMHLLVALTIYLGAGAMAAISVVPLIVIVFIFKFYIHQAFYSRFMWYVPDQAELAQSKIHSERSDVQHHRLERRFGHPALHAELFTPMVHANMAHLLPEVYHGRLAYGTAKVAEYGGQKLEAQVAGGIMIASVDQRDLAYDPQLYQRDRGEQDWDARSMASTAMLTNEDADGSPKSPQPGAQFPLSTPPLSKVPGYDAYMQQGPARAYPNPSTTSLGREEIELARLEYDDQHPLLSRQQTTESIVQPGPGSYPPMPQYTQAVNAGRQSPAQVRSPPMPRPDAARSTSSLGRGPDGQFLPSTPRPARPIRQPTSDSDGRNTNMAGRGTYGANQGQYGQGPQY